MSQNAGQQISTICRPGLPSGELRHLLVELRHSAARIRQQRRLPTRATTAPTWSFTSGDSTPIARTVLSVTLADLVTRYHIQEVALLDSNFLVDIKRALAIAQGIVTSGVRFRWDVPGFHGFLWKMSDDEVGLFGESGVSTWVSVQNPLPERAEAHEQTSSARRANGRDGAEGGTGRDSRHIQRDFRLSRGNRSGSPTDLPHHERHRQAILECQFLAQHLHTLPGNSDLAGVGRLGVREPQTLEEWAELPLGHNVLPWLQGEELKRLRRSLEYFLLNNQIRKATRKHAWLRRGFRRALGVPIRWRIGRNRYSFPWELWVSRQSKKWSLADRC